MFENSFNDTLDQYRELLKQERETQKPAMSNDNFDLGEVSAPGKYYLSDTTHAKLLDKLAEQKFVGATPEIRAELLDFFSVNKATFETAKDYKKDKKLWDKVPGELEQLKSAPIEQKTAATGR
jgi:hypothetical protein